MVSRSKGANGNYDLESLHMMGPPPKHSGDLPKGLAVEQRRLQHKNFALFLCHRDGQLAAAITGVTFQPPAADGPEAMTLRRRP